MQMTGHLIVKKIWGTKMYFTIKFERTIYVTCVLHFSHLSSNSALTPQKKKYNWALIWAQLCKRKVWEPNYKFSKISLM